MSSLTKRVAAARHASVWISFFLLAMLAWIPTLSQTASMLATSSPLFGTMGLAIGPFLVFWIVMMIAMMLPALAPAASVRHASLLQHKSGGRAFYQLLVFLLGYLLIWSVSGVPIFFLARLGEQFALTAPLIGLAFGIALLAMVGFYQMTPWQRRYLMHCNPTLCYFSTEPTNTTLFTELRIGLTHGLTCLGCCGGLMLVMIAVGLMNLPWMLLLTVLIFLQKTWRYGDRLSFFVGFGLLIFAALALAEPALLPGLFRPF